MKMKRQIFKKTLIAFLAMLFLAAAAVALLQFLPANADESLVLPGNTAEYTIADIGSKSFNANEAKYDKITNTWDSNYANTFELLLNVTKVPEAGSGSIAFEWQVAKTGKNLIVKKYPGGDKEKEGTLYEATAKTAKVYETYTINDVVVGDQISILYTGGYSYKLMLHGLQMPADDQFEFTAKIAEGLGHGKITGDRDGETSDEQGELKFSRGYGDSFTLTAEPEEGYVAFWQRETDQLSYYSANNEITVNNIQINSKGAKYYVRFLKLDDENPLAATWQAPIESGLGWANEDGKYQAKNVDGIDYKSPSSTLTVVANGDAYLKFTYAFSSEDTTYASGNPHLKMTRNGQNDPLVDSSLPTTYILGSDIKEVTGYLHLSNEGLNVVDIQLSGSGAIGHSAPVGTTVYFKDFEVVTEDELPETEVHFHYNPHYADLTINEQPVEEAGSEIVDHVFTAKFGQPFNYKIKANSGVISSIDNETTVKTQFVALNTNTDYKYWGEEEENVGFFTDGLVSTGGTKLTLNEDEEAGNNDLHLRFDYQEYAPKAKVTASMTADGQVSEIEIKDNSTVDFPYNKDNSIIIRIHNFDKILAEEITVKIDGTILPSNKITKYNDYFGFVIDDVRQKNVEIIYNNEKYNCSEATLSFKLREVYDGVISDIVTAGEVTIENDQKTPWIFSSVYSEGENYAFMAGNSINVNGESSEFLTGGGSSVIGFKLNAEEAGVLSFEFQMQGIYEDFMGMHNFVYQTLAYYRFTHDFSSKEREQTFITNTLAEQTHAGKTPEEYIISWEYPASLLARAIDTSGRIGYGDYTKSVGNTGWYRVSIQVPKENINDTLYLFFFSGKMMAPDTQTLLIRNVNFISGTATASIEIEQGGFGSVTALLNGADSKNVTPDSSVNYEIAIGDKLTLTAEHGDYVFYGWTVNGKWLSEEPSIEYTVDSATTQIVAHIMPKDYYKARHDGTFYQDLFGENGAFTKVTEGNIIITSDSIEISQNLEIKKGVSLILPYSSAGEYFKMGDRQSATTQISWADEELEGKYKFFTLTIGASATVTVNGGLYIGGVLNYPAQSYQGHTSGAYSELINKGKIVVENGGVMDVYGRVWGGKDSTAMGTIEVKNGGKLYEPFLILDFAGGTNTLDTFSANATPFKRYAMINIENAITIYYGGQLIGHATLYALDMFVSLDQPFISDEHGDGKGNDTMIMLKPNSSVKVEYDSSIVAENKLSNCTQLIGKTTMTFTGGAKFSYMLFTALGISIPTTSVYFSIPYNFDIELNGKGANYETKTDFMIMPGATVTVGEGATLTLKANAWVYDGLQAGNQAGKSYPTADDLQKVGYSKSGNLIVNGTLVMDKKNQFDKNGVNTNQMVPISFLGIIQTNGDKGRIEIGEGVTLSGKIFDGIQGQNYFEYKTTARIYDSKTQKIVELTAGHEYTAKGAEEFTLVSLTYGKEVGKQDQNLTLNQTMHGSWMIVHAHHQYDWTLKEDEQNFGSEKTKDITRECTELGCTQKETRTLIKVETGLNIGDLVYDGENVTAEELIALFKKYYGEKVTGFNFSAEFTAQKNHGDWDVTITIGTDNVYFYTTGNTADLKEFTFKYTITPAEIDGLELNADRAYNGTKLSNDEVIKAVKSGSLTLSANDYDVEIINNSADAGEYTVKVTGKNNFEGEQQATYTIKAVDITIKVNSGTATYAGKKTAPEINATHAQTGKFVGGDGFKSVTVVVKEVPGEWSAKTYELTVKYELNETTNKGNYKITVDDAGAILTVNKAQVTLTVKGKNASYNSKGGYDVAWELDGIDGFLGEYEAAEALKMLTITCDVNTNNTVGNHDINAVLNAEYAWSGGVAGELENFTVTCKGGTYNISPVGYGNLSFGGEKSVTYDGKEHGLTLTVDDESVTVTIYYKLNTADDGDYKQDKPVNVGTYNVKAVLQSENYNDGDEFTFTTGGELVINPTTIDGLTLTATSKKYDKQAIVPAELVESVTAGSLTLQKGDYDVKVDKDTVTVGDYTITVTGKGNYTGQKTATYKIEKKDITVTVYDQEKDYDNNSATLTQSGENVLKIADLCPDDDLGITLGLGTNASKKDKGDYPIIPAIGGTVVANNYNITFKNGTGETFTLTDETHVNYPMYHIKAIKAIVTIDDVTDKIYGDEVVTTFTHKTSGFIPGDSYTPTINYTCTLEEKPAANETGYDITGKVTNPNGNYEIEVKPGKYIIKQRPITVTINDQSSDYKHDHSYPFNANDWTTEDELAYDDDNAALQITLNHGELTDAGAYDITGSCANTNYKVTFKGNKEETKGVYTVNKLDISAEAIFWLTSEQGKDWTQDNDGYRVKYTGTPLSFTGHATYTQGDDDIELQVTINPETVQGEGETSVTMTISDKNYAGSKTVTLVVTDADGYTARLREALASLEGLAEGMDSEAFKEEDFGKLKQMQQIISTLDEKEREVAQSAIEGYEQLIDDWNSLADADSIIVAAETIADAPINGLFEAAAVTMALISLAYIAIKGGLL